VEFELWQYVIFALVGLFCGFINAIVGGGGFISLPMLMWLGIPPLAAIATNKFQAFFGVVTAAIDFIRSGTVKWQGVIYGVISTALGAVLGVVLLFLVSKEFLNYAVLVLLIFFFFYTLLNPDFGATAAKPKGNVSLLYVICGFIIGVYDGFFGPGNASLWLFALICLIGADFKTAVANTRVLDMTSKIVTMIVLLVAVAMGNAIILFKVGVIMAIFQIIGAHLGAKYAMRVDTAVVRRVFLGVLLIMILGLVYKTFA